MAENTRHDEIFELTEEMAKDQSDKGVANDRERDSAPRISAPPKAVSPFQPLVDPNAKPEEEIASDPPPAPDPRPSFTPKPITDPVKLSPIQQVIGKTESVPPPDVSQPPPQPIQDTISKSFDSTLDDASQSETMGEAVLSAVENMPKESDVEQLSEDDISHEDSERPITRDDIEIIPEPDDDEPPESSPSDKDPDKSPLKQTVPATPTIDDNDNDDDAVELDLSEVEEMPKTPPVPPVKVDASDSRKPRLRRRQKNKEWWAQIFNDDYVSTIPEATVKGDQRKVNFIEKSLGVSTNALILDLACGNGRHAVGMAKRGYRMVGIDLSLPMLAQAAELAQEENQNINFIHGDMRDLSFDKTFDSVFCMGTSFGFFDDDSNLKVLQGVYRALKPGGTFLIEVANRDHVITQVPDLTWFEGNGSICMEESQFDFYTSRLIVTRQLIMDGGRQVQNDVSIRLYTLSELCNLFKQVGFNVGQISGHTATKGAFFGPDSIRIFLTSQRPL